MLERLNKSDYDTLKVHFDTYCQITYDRLYPFTLNNLKRYLEQAVLNFLEKDNQEVEDGENFRWTYSEELTCYIPIKNHNNEDNTIFIRDDRIFNTCLMSDFNDSLVLW